MSPARINLTAGRAPTYYRVETTHGGQKIRISDLHMMQGANVFVARGWDRVLREGLHIESIDPRSTAFQANRGQMLGRVFSYDNQGNEVGQPTTIPLGNYQVLDRAAHIQAVVEIVPSTANPANKLMVIERKMNTTGLMEDRSKIVYTLDDAAARTIEQEVVDLDWIQKVTITADRRIIVTFLPAGQTAPHTVIINGTCVKDNDGQPLLANRSAGLTTLDDIYQSPFYTRETDRFRPVIDSYNGNLRLIVHNVKRREIDRPEGLKIPKDGTVKIFPSSADATVMIEGVAEPIPLTLQEPLKRLELIDHNLSQILEGIIKSVVGPQIRFGERNNISAEYPRDPYFYGLVVFALFRTLESWGENFAINRAKSVRAFRGIESGRTHVMGYKMLFNALADLLETNSPYYKKLSNFAEEIWGPGVSEDTQMEVAYWLKGIKMWVVKQTIAFMAAEKEHGRYDKQNTQRYDYSEVLFILACTLAKADVIEARLGGKYSPRLNWAEMQEVFAGRTWYKFVIGKLAELSAIPIFLGTMGHILTYPVDLLYFVISWAVRTSASTLNYALHLATLGYNFLTGFWKNPALEMAFMKGYLRAAFRQFLDRNQFGTFMTTVSGSGAAVPKDYKRLIQGLAATTGTALAASAAVMALGGLASWLVLPLSLAAIPVGLSAFATGRRSHVPLIRRALTIAGVTLAGGGLALTVVSAPILTANYLSIAFIANFGFGLYQLGLLGKALAEMKMATREGTEKNPARQLSQPVAKRFAAIQNSVMQQRFNLSYQDLLSLRNELKTILRSIDVMDSRGNIRQGTLHPYRAVSHQILDVYAKIEILSCLKARQDLRQNPNNAAAREMLLTLLRESREHVVINYAAMTYRRLQMEL